MFERARLALSSPQDESAALATLTADEAWNLIAAIEGADRDD